jgi:metal transporter CNNM
MSLICLIICGFNAGVAVGYMSLDSLNLELILMKGTDEEKRNVNIILPIIKKHHLLLSTVLIFNALAAE